MKKNKITIELHSLLKDVVMNFWVVILSVLVSTMGFYLVTHTLYEPVYTATATLSVINGRSNTASYSTYTVSTEQANVLVNVFTEPMVKEYAAKHLGVNKFDGKISARVLEQTNFIELNVSSDHPEKAYDLLNAVIKTHNNVSGKIFRNADLTVVKMPTVPTGPSNRISNSNRSLINIAFATVSLALIIVFSVMRNTVKKESDFDDNIDSKLIGTITHENKKITLDDIRQKKKKGLLIHSHAYISLRFTENFHKIAAKIEHKKVDSGCKVFAITSVAENEGKSTCAANIALSLADRGNKVLLVDFDFKKPALYKIFFEESARSVDLSELLGNKLPLENFALGQFKKTSLSLAITNKASLSYHTMIENGSLSKLISEFRPDYDFIIIDTAPLSLDSSVTDVISMVDETILIIRTDTVNTSVINDAIATISTISSNLAGCILNDVYMNVLPFSITGDDQSKNYHRYGYKKYSYGKYSYGRYSPYGHYGNYGHYDQHTQENES